MQEEKNSPPREIYINDKEDKENVVNKFSKRNKFLVIIISSLFTIGFLVGIYWWSQKNFPPFLQKFSNEENQIKVIKEEPKFPSLLTGELVPKERANLRPFAIVIENHPEARPQSGLSEAGLVYEAITEGGITRYLAFFDELPDKIGPIRSARIFFVDWAKEIPAFFVHCGGNAVALEKIKKLDNFFDLDEFAFGNYFWRDSTRYAPHNLYTSKKLLNQLVSDKGWEKNLNYPSFSFKDDEEEAKRGDFRKATIYFSSKTYEVSYVYDKSSNTYKRYLAGEPHKDLDGKEINVKNVVLANYSGYQFKSGNSISWFLETDKGGRATILLDGKKIEGSWQKGDDSRTRFFDENGEEIRFNRGNTWIEALAPTIDFLIE